MRNHLDQNQGQTVTLLTTSNKNEKLSSNQRDLKENQQPGKFKIICTHTLNIIFAIIFGVLFGFFMNKGTVFVAPTIRLQMIFQRFAMLKMFLSAVGVSMLSIAMLELLFRNAYQKVFNSYVEHNIRRGVLHFLFGGSMIGLGMVVCGSCPGTVFVQVGSGILNSLLTCLGGILGTLFYYSFVHEQIIKEKVPATAIVQRRLSDILHVPSIILHAAFGLILLGVAIGLEFAVPWKKDLNSRLITTGSVDPEQTPGHIFGMAAWPPTICGAGVGLLQFFFILLLEKSLGVSSAFTVFSAQICRIKPIGRALPSLNAFTYGLKNYVALLFAVGAHIPHPF